MSGVPERLRGVSSYEFYNTAIELRVEVLMLVTGSAIPKSRRFTFAVPMADTARELVADVVRADAFYPNTEEGVAMRRRYLTLAMACCGQLMQDVQAYLEVYRRKPGAPAPHASSFERVAALCETERKLLKGARDRVRLLGRAER